MVSGDVMLSVDEVNQRLPLVRSIVRDIVDLHSDLSLRKTRLATILEQRSGGHSGEVYEDEVQQMEAEIAADEQRMSGFCGELQQLGGVLRDPISGTVDFASTLQGDVVSLCWQPPEPQVMYWHSGECSQSERILLCPEAVAGQPDDDELVR
ncbi:MAG: DUF2203 domain-containing protein [Planctomycetaceae bacterium]|nr:DUF2203 domain-containing protein [Planctomycetaceae bacterium]